MPLISPWQPPCAKSSCGLPLVMDRSTFLPLNFPLTYGTLPDRYTLPAAKTRSLQPLRIAGTENHHNGNCHIIGSHHANLYCSVSISISNPSFSLALISSYPNFRKESSFTVVKLCLLELGLNSIAYKSEVFTV